MNRTLTISISTVALLLGGGRAFAGWTQNPNTGHWYRITEFHGTSQQNQDEASAEGGYLAAIGDSAENQWILDHFSPQNPNQGLAIGFYQPQGSSEPDGGWSWVNGETVNYTNWRGGEPNNVIRDGVGEDVAYMHWLGHADAGTWYDGPAVPAQGRGVIERDAMPSCVTCPTVSEWGLLVMTCLTLAAGTMILTRARRVPA